MALSVCRRESFTRKTLIAQQAVGVFALLAESSFDLVEVVADATGSDPDERDLPSVAPVLNGTGSDTQMPSEFRCSDLYSALWLIIHNYAGKCLKDLILSVFPLKMRDDLRKLAGWLKVVERTVRRWCEKGLVPGAYRPKKGKGHWRVRNLEKAWLALMDRPGRVFRQKGKPQVCTSTSKDSLVERHKAKILNPDSPTNLITRIYFAYKHGITREELKAKKWRAHTSEAREDLWRKPLAELYKEIPRKLWVIAHDPPRAHLFLAASKLRFKEGAATAKGLASELGISRASLYRKYTSRQIQFSLHTVWQTITPTLDNSAHAQSVREHKRQIRYLFHDIGKSHLKR